MAFNYLIAPKYRCDICLEIHDYEDDAIDCCQPTISDVFICPECNIEYATEKLAIVCCNFTEKKLNIVSAEELEAHGQARLEEF